MFELLGAGARSVGDLATQLLVSRPAVSQHLKVLKDAGLVTAESQGTRRLHGLDALGVGAVRDYFDTFWNEALVAFKEAAEQPLEEQT